MTSDPMTHVGTFMDWCPIAPLSAFDLAESRDAPRVAGTLPDLRSQPAYDRYLRPFVERLDFAARADGIFVFRIHLYRTVAERISARARGEWPDMAPSSTDRATAFIRDIIANGGSSDAQAAIELVLQNLAQHASNAIKACLGHAHCFHEPEQRLPLDYCFVIEPVRLTGEPPPEILTTTGLAEAPAPFAGAAVQPVTIENVPLIELLRDAALLSGRCEVTAGIDAGTPPALELFERFRAFRDQVVSAVVRRKAGPLYSLFLLYAVLTVLASVNASVWFFGYRTMASVMDHIAVLLSMAALASALVAFAMNVATLRPFFFRRAIGLQSLRNRLVRLLQGVPLGWIFGVPIIVLIPATAVYLWPILTSRGGLWVATPLLIPVLASVFLVLEFSNQLRRYPIVELHQNALGFLAYYQVYAQITDAMYRARPGNASRISLTTSLEPVAESIRWRLAREQERYRVEREFLLLTIGVISAFAALAALFQLFDAATANVPPSLPRPVPFFE
jgi:hypothetical protein